jgi:hypothetical protein
VLKFVLPFGQVSSPLLHEDFLNKHPSFDNVSWDTGLLHSVEFNSNWASYCNLSVASLAVVSGF